MDIFKFLEEKDKREKEIFDQLRREEKIREAVLLCSPKNKFKLKSALPDLFIVASCACDDEVVYMVTDKEWAEEMKRTVKE